MVQSPSQKTHNLNLSHTHMLRWGQKPHHWLPIQELPHYGYFSVLHQHLYHHLPQNQSIIRLQVNWHKPRSIELRCGAQDIEIPDLSTYKRNRKNETKEKKNARNQPSKNGEQKKVVGTTTTIRHIFQLSSTVACTGSDSYHNIFPTDFISSQQCIAWGSMSYTGTNILCLCHETICSRETQWWCLLAEQNRKEMTKATKKKERKTKRKKNQTSNQTLKEEEARETITHDLKRMIFLRRKWVDLQSSAFRIDINIYAAERCCQISAWKTNFLPWFLPHLYQIEKSSIKNMKSIEKNYPHLFSDPPFLRRSSTRLPWPAFAAQRSALSPCCRCVAQTRHILKLNFCSLLSLETQLQMQLPESFLWLGILQKNIEERERLHSYCYDVTDGPLLWRSLELHL